MCFCSRHSPRSVPAERAGALPLVYMVDQTARIVHGFSFEAAPKPRKKTIDKRPMDGYSISIKARTGTSSPPRGPFREPPFGARGRARAFVWRIPPRAAHRRASPWASLGRLRRTPPLPRAGREIPLSRRNEAGPPGSGECEVVPRFQRRLPMAAHRAPGRRRFACPTTPSPSNSNALLHQGGSWHERANL